jgi:hypothetical protein
MELLQKASTRGGKLMRRRKIIIKKEKKVKIKGGIYTHRLLGLVNTKRGAPGASSSQQCLLKLKQKSYIQSLKILSCRPASNDIPVISSSQ